MSVVRMGIEREDQKSGGTPPLPGVPPAIRTERQKATMFQSDVETDDADLNDISAIIHGAKAITGKAVYSARNSDQTETQKENQKKHEAVDQEARELMHLAEWNGQMTNVGGVEMTNEEAQKARQHIIDNEDYYAKRAVKEGRILASEQEEYKFNNRRIKELNDKDGRGIATSQEKEEREQRQHSRLGRQSEHDAGELHAQSHEQKIDASTKADQDFSKLNSNAASSVYGDSFQTSARPTESFNKQAAGSIAAPVEKVADNFVPPSQKVAATGFGV